MLPHRILFQVPWQKSKGFPNVYLWFIYIYMYVSLCISINTQVIWTVWVFARNAPWATRSHSSNIQKMTYKCTAVESKPWKPKRELWRKRTNSKNLNKCRRANLQISWNIHILQLTGNTQKCPAGPSNSINPWVELVSVFIGTKNSFDLKRETAGCSIPLSLSVVFTC